MLVTEFGWPRQIFRHTDEPLAVMCNSGLARCNQHSHENCSSPTSFALYLRATFYTTEHSPEWNQPPMSTPPLLYSNLLWIQVHCVNCVPCGTEQGSMPSIEFLD